MDVRLNGPIAIKGLHRDGEAVTAYVVTASVGRGEPVVVCVSVDRDACERITEKLNDANIHDLIPLVVESYAHRDLTCEDLAL